MPIHSAEYAALLGRESPVERMEPGWVWAFPERLEFPNIAPLVRSETPEGASLPARLESKGMPAAMTDMGFDSTAEFRPPWCAVFDGPEIASIAFAAGIGPAAAEIGVATMPACRGRGFAAAAAAGWAAHPALSRTLSFYRTEDTNRSSRRVAERLGLRFLGSRLVIASAQLLGRPSSP